jgi:hypothetical protein
MTQIKNKILAAVMTLFAVLGIFVFVASSIAYARQADIVKDLTSSPIPADRTDPFYIYFTYGSINSDTDILNAQASINLTGSGFAFVPTGFSDLYYGSPTRSDADNPPDQATCNSTYTGPVYPISSTLATTTSFTYGFQSANQTSTQSGQSGATTLRAKNTGCIKVKMIVSPGASAGQQATITYDPDAATSPSYQEVNRPGKQIVTIQVGAPTGAVNTPTTIAANNLTNGSCTGVQVGNTTTCNFSLTGSSSNNYALPSNGITVTVPGSSASPACTLVNNNASNAGINCSNVPTSGASAGNQSVPTSLGSSPTASLTLTAVPPTSITISASNLSSGSCTSVQVGTATTCTYPLTGGSSFTLPNGGISVTVLGSTASPACSISGTSLVCTNVPTTGASAGTLGVATSLGSSPTASLTLTSPSTTSTSSTTTSGSSTSSTSSTSSSSSSSSSSTTSTSGTTAATTTAVTSGQTTINGNNGDVNTIASPLTGINKFEVTLNDTVSNLPLSYNLISGTGSCTNTVPGTERLANTFTYGFDKTKVQQIKVTFTLPSNVTNVKAYSCSSPGVETTVQSLGNNQYTAVIPAAATFLVTADTANTATTTRTGGFEIFALIAGIGGTLGIAYLVYQSRKKVGKIDVVE